MSLLVSVLFSVVGILIIPVNGCDLTLSDPTGVFSSPGYNSSYASNLDCEWTFQASAGMVIEVTFEVVDLEEKPLDSNCLDYIEIYDGDIDSDTLVSSFCGNGPGWPSHPSRFLSTSERLTVIMQTDPHVSTNTGFRASYKQVPPRTEYIAAVATDVSALLLFNRFSTRVQRLPLPESSRPSAVSFDPIDGYFYYTDVQEKFIGRVRLDDISQFDIIIRDGIENSQGIAVAYLTRLLYWTDVARDEVSVSRLDGTFRKTIAPKNTGCDTPRGIAFTNDQQYVFWSCTTSIERSRADGSNRQKVLSGLNNVTTLAIDPEGENLYLVNVQDDEGFLNFVNIKSGLPTLQPLYRGELFLNVHSFVIDFFAFFWTHPGERKIYHVERGELSLRTLTLKNSPPRMEGLYYLNSDNVSLDLHQCAVNNGGCTEMCFPNAESKSCVDVSPLVSGCPSNIVMSTCGPQNISWEEPTALSRSNGQTSINLDYKRRTHNPGSTFFWGSVTVQYDFRDEFGITSSCSFYVSLLEIVSTPIEISGCPDDIIITAMGPRDVMWREPTASSGGVVALDSASHQPGTTFPLGSTEVRYVFVDECGQEASCTFNINLLTPTTSPNPTKASTTKASTMAQCTSVLCNEYIDYAIIGAAVMISLLVVLTIACIACCCGCWQCKCRPKERRPTVENTYKMQNVALPQNTDDTYMYADCQYPTYPTYQHHV